MHTANSLCSPKPKTREEQMTVDYEVYELGNFEFQSGTTLESAKLAYKTFGELNADKSNAIVYPTWYSGLIEDNYWLAGKGMGLDPSKYFIIIPALFGNGESSSPSNTPKPRSGPRFPNCTFYDNVRAQHQLVTEHLGIDHLRLVLGWSMGAGQTYQWGVQYPDMMDALLPFCGSAKTSPNNIVFLNSVAAALTADAAWDNGWYEKQPDVGLRAMARVYSGWGLSGKFYWDEVWRQLGYASLDDFLIGFWEGSFLARDANNLLAMLWTWKMADVGKTPGFEGSTRKALAAIKARLIQMPAHEDRYFAPEEEKYASQFIRNSEFREIPGIWGHYAGGGVNPADTAFIDSAVKEILGDD